MALRHAAVLTNPGSYVMSPASSADVLICRRSMARTVPSWTGSSYCLPVRLSTTVRVSLGTRGVLDFGWGKITSEGREGRWKAVSAARASPPFTAFPRLVFSLHMTHPTPPKRASRYPTRGAAGALLGQQLAARGYIGCLLLVITPEGVEIAANAAKAMGAQFDVLVAAFIKLGSNLAPIAAIDESRARVSQDLILYRTQRPVKTLAGKVAVIVDGQVVYPWKVLAAAKAAEQLGAKQVVIATPVATQTAADRIRARSYEVVCPSVVVETTGHPAPYGDMTGETPERLRSIMIAHQAA